jgi:3-oxoacyl-(acyl-carrier-protein) synthase
MGEGAGVLVLEELEQKKKGMQKYTLKLRAMECQVMRTI